MLAKLSAKNQLTIPKAIINQMNNPEYFDVVFDNGRLVLTPVSVASGDTVRSKLEVLGITEQDVEDAIKWSRR